MALFMFKNNRRTYSKVSILGVESLLPFCAWLFRVCKNAPILRKQNLINVRNSALKFIEFIKEKFIRFGKV